MCAQQGPIMVRFVLCCSRVVRIECAGKFTWWHRFLRSSHTGADVHCVAPLCQQCGPLADEASRYLVKVCSVCDTSTGVCTTSTGIYGVVPSRCDVVQMVYMAKGILGIPQPPGHPYSMYRDWVSANGAKHSLMCWWGAGQALQSFHCLANASCLARGDRLFLCAGVPWWLSVCLHV